jgi:DNA-binding NtrC family response regulator
VSKRPPQHSPHSTQDPSTTTTVTREGWLAPRGDRATLREAYALVIAWSLAEPHRVGETALFGDETPAQILGRGGPQGVDDAPRVRFVRHRPSGSEAQPPLAASGISRTQMRLTPSAEGIAFERLGRCPLRHNGNSVDRGIVRPGDVLTLQNQLVLYCVRRTTSLSSTRDSSPREAGARVFGAPDVDGIVGESEATWRFREELAIVAPSAAHVLVLGESGVGKELASRAVHRMSTRASRAFVARSAAAIPPALLDAELFGNRRDYPNAGMHEREGIVGAAHGGTLFLDEIGELGSELQTHLLRLLDSGGEYHRLGEAHARRSDLRLVAATNRSPAELKHDFAARFSVRITVPGLDARREDVPLLARHLLEEAASSSPGLRERFFEAGPNGATFPRIDPAFMEALLQWRWTLHVRELRTLLWSSIRTSPSHFLAIPPEILARKAEPPQQSSEGDEPSARAIVDALARHAGNQSKAYADLGLPSRFALYRLMRKYGIDARVPEARRK